MGEHHCDLGERNGPIPLRPDCAVKLRNRMSWPLTRDESRRSCACSIHRSTRNARCICL